MHTKPKTLRHQRKTQSLSYRKQFIRGQAVSFKLLANNSAIHYTTQIDLVDYINAFRNLKFSVEKNMVNNPSALTVFFKKGGKIYSVLPGKTIFLSN